MTKGKPHSVMDSNIVIRASAGTGKTHQLAVRFLGLLARGVSPDEILATTFTRKAAGEILDRVLHRLAVAAADANKARVLAGEIGDPELTRERCRTLLIETARQLHRVRVGTLDSHFIQVAGSFALELGLTPGWSICEPQDDELLREEAIEHLLSGGRMVDLLTLVHALTKGDAVRSISQLIHGTVGGLFEMYRETSPPAWTQVPAPPALPPEELERACNAMASFPLDARMGKARDADLIKARAGDWCAFISAGLASKVLSGECAFFKKPIPVELVALYRLLLKQAESVFLGRVARQTLATHDLLERFAEHYRHLQVESGALRFSDVTHRLAQAGMALAAEQLAFRLDGGIRHVLLDEFQDTSPLQWQVLRPLVQSVFGSDRGSFFCVGDAKQAIYGWRGGVAEIFDALDGELPGLKQSDLATSFRSAQPVIDCVNQVFSHLTGHPNLESQTEAVAAWQRRFPAHSTARTELAGYVVLETSREAAEGENQDDVTLEEAADRVEALVKQSPSRSVGVLVRRNVSVAKLVFLLRKRGIPASEEGGHALVDSPAVEVILSLLRLADHPGDQVARFHLATSPLASALELTEDGGAHPVALSRRLRRQLLEEGYGATVHAWCRMLADCCDERDLSRLQQLVEMAYSWQRQSTLRADDFVAFVESQPVADPAVASVRVMTIHQAKGLQFDIVVLPELWTKLAGQPGQFAAGRPAPTQPVDLVCRLANKDERLFFPPRLAKLFEEEAARKVSEALCLLYVGMTRAVHALYMLMPPAKPNERNLPKTYAGLLRATLAPTSAAAPSAVLYEHGNAQWHRAPGKQDRVAANAEAATVRPALHRPNVITLAAPLARRERGLERLSPSMLEGGPKLPAKRLLEVKSAAAFDYGTLVHAWLQEIGWLDDGVPNDSVLAGVAQRLAGSLGHVPRDLKSSLAEFRRQIAVPSIASALSRAFYAAQGELEVIRERRFAAHLDDRLVTGSIDRLVIAKRGGRIAAADVLDFKTDDIAADDAAAVAQKVKFYQPQLNGYRQAIAQVLRIKPAQVSAHLVFLKPGRVERID